MRDVHKSFATLMNPTRATVVFRAVERVACCVTNEQLGMRCLLQYINCWKQMLILKLRPKNLNKW